MKKLIPLFMLLLVSLVWSEQTNIKYALNELENSAKSFMLIIAVVLLVLGLVLAAIGAGIYLKKLKGVEKRETLWLALAVLFGGLGILSLLGGIAAILIYVFLPNMISSLMGG